MRVIGERRTADASAPNPEATLLIRSAALADWLALVIVTLYELAGGDHGIDGRVIVAMVAFAAVSLLLRIPRVLGRSPDTKLYARVLATTSFIAFVVWNAGGASSPLVSLYLLPIMLTALALRTLHLVLLLVLITTLYVLTARYSSGVDVTSAAFAARLFSSLGPSIVVAWLTAELGNQLIAARRRERDSAHADPITGLANRATFNEAVDVERHRASRDGRRYAVVVVRLEPTPSEPGEHPGAAAAAALKLLASVLQRALRDTDLAARTADHTFAVLLAGADADAAQTVANRIRHAVHAATVQVGSRMVRVQAQCAVADAPADGMLAGDLLAAAERRLAEEAIRRQNALPMS
jgi:diguanylate cyclase (GGDEF)-like protein